MNDNITMIRDEACRALWVEMNHKDDWPRFTMEMLDDLQEAANTLGTAYGYGARRPLFQVMVSDNPEAFSLGGDIPNFIEWIRDGNDDMLRIYARKCIHLFASCNCHYKLPIETIAVVEGKALGGGFECALAHRRIIADPGATFGFPEVQFGMFPGMGAVSALTRKIGAKRAQDIIMSGRVITCRDAHEMGIVDNIANIKGDARGAASRYMTNIVNNPGRVAALKALLSVEEHVTVSELDEIVNIWVNCALTLDERNIERMETIVKSQERGRR